VRGAGVLQNHGEAWSKWQSQLRHPCPAVLSSGIIEKPQFHNSSMDEFVINHKMPFSVIPAEAGIQEYQELLDPGFRRGDGLGIFYQSITISSSSKG
jgi:hypothetical protein